MTAVEWLANEIDGLDTAISYDFFQKKVQQANELFEHQIKDAWKDGAYGGGQFTTTFDNAEQYYNETYKNETK